jgi:hypothetical protein
MTPKSCHIASIIRSRQAGASWSLDLARPRQVLSSECMVLQVGWRYRHRSRIRLDVGAASKWADRRRSSSPVWGTSTL